MQPGVLGQLPDPVEVSTDQRLDVDRLPRHRPNCAGPIDNAGINHQPTLSERIRSMLTLAVRPDLRRSRMTRRATRQ